MSPIFHVMPVDKTIIKSRLRIHPKLLADPNDFIRSQGLLARSSKPTWGRSNRGPTWNLALKLLTYRGIEVRLTKVDGDPMTDAAIHFNPGVCLHGHNGLVLSLVEFLDALAILVTHLKPLLMDPNDWVGLVPGLRSGGVTYWNYVEVNFHSADPDGSVLARFRQARHPSIRTAARHWSESISFGGQRGKLRIGIYRKAVEMIAHDKLLPTRLPDHQHVLRFEIRLEGKKLVHYLGNERNVEVIDEVPRLVRFLPQDLVGGLRGCLSEFEGVFAAEDALNKSGPREQHAPLGRLLARVALDSRTTQTLSELLDHTKFYAGAPCTTKEARKRLSATMGKIRKAGMAELSSRSSLSCDEFFSDAAFQAQHGIGSAEQEEKVSHEIEDTFVHRLIYEAYRPSDQPFQPRTEWPGYLCP